MVRIYLQNGATGSRKVRENTRESRVKISHEKKACRAGGSGQCMKFSEGLREVTTTRGGYVSVWCSTSVLPKEGR